MTTAVDVAGIAAAQLASLRVVDSAAPPAADSQMQWRQRHENLMAPRDEEQLGSSADVTLEQLPRLLLQACQR